MRSCRESKWKLTRGSDALTSGYYYWAPEGTPHFPGTHLLGSRFALSESERASLDDLGEYDGPWKWRDGSPPAAIPAPRTIGSLDCIGNGERETLISLPFTPGTPGLTLPYDCYVKADLDFDHNVFDCRFQWYAADIIRRAYEDTNNAREFALEYFGVFADAVEIPLSGDGMFPPLIVVKRGNKAFLFITGTAESIQWIGQGLIAVDGIMEQGAYSTGRIWEFAARRTLDAAAAWLGDDINHWVICGHSYGGAITQLFAAKLLIADPSRRVDMLTFGSPKPGDIRLQQLIERQRQVHLVNQNDFIPFLPPRLLPGWANDLIGAVLRSRWQTFHRPRHLTFIPSDGSVPVRITEDRVSLSLTGTIAAGLAAGILPNAPFPHVMAAYCASIRRYCPHLLPPYPPGQEWGGSVTFDPLRRWPNLFTVELLFGEILTCSITVRYDDFVSGPFFVRWAMLGNPRPMCDLNGGNDNGKITVNSLEVTYTSAGEAFVVNLGVTAPFMIGGAPVLTLNGQNPMDAVVDFIPGGTGTLTTPAGDVSRTFTARISGPFVT